MAQADADLSDATYAFAEAEKAVAALPDADATERRVAELRSRAEAAQAALAEVRAEAAPPPSAGAPLQRGGQLPWPVHGRVLAGYGTGSGGTHNDGINIAAPVGAPVKASAPGVVAYAGNELRGFGNMVLLRHADGWVTAYAHNSSLLVKKGDKVTQGQAIARVGSSGNVDSPQLHFELRKGTKAVDPLKVLTK